jgi:hypothetical protein
MTLTVYFHDNTFAFVEGVEEVRRQNGYFDVFDDDDSLLFTTAERNVKYVAYKYD